MYSATLLVLSPHPPERTLLAATQTSSTAMGGTVMTWVVGQCLKAIIAGHGAFLFRLMLLMRGIRIFLKLYRLPKVAFEPSVASSSESISIFLYWQIHLEKRQSGKLFQLRGELTQEIC